MKSVALPRIVSSNTLNKAFKVLVLFLLLGILYFELAIKENLNGLWIVFRQQLLQANPIWLLLALCLMPLNWMLEARKWHFLLHRFEPLSLWQAQKAVLAGVAVSIFTPNRIGEVGGRMLFVQPTNYWKALKVSLLGSMAQMLVLLTCGLAGASWLLFHLRLVRSGQLLFWLPPIGLALVFIYWCYFHLPWVMDCLQRKTLLQRIKRFAKGEPLFTQFEPAALGIVLGWSALRYGIYASQYFLLLKFFEIDTGVIMGFSGIFALFLAQTSIPLPPLTGLVARGNLAIWLWAQAGANELSSLSATFVLWIINLILPALVGTFFLFHVNIAKKDNYENEHH